MARAARLASFAMIGAVIGAGATAAAPWSPDGALIAYSFIGGPENIHVTAPDGGAPRLLVGGAARSFRPEWAPDGSHLVFTSVVDGRHVVMCVDRDGNNLRTMSNPEDAAGDPDYSPDGTKLLYFTDNPGARDLFYRDLETGEEIALTETSGFDEMSPRWAPDGRQIVFVGNSGAEGENSDIWMLDVETGARRNVTNSPDAGEFHPDWSHDGDSLIYVKVESGKFNIAIRSIATGAESIVARGGGYAVLAPHFAPDDRSISFTRTDFAEEGPGMPAIMRLWLEDGREDMLARGCYLTRMLGDGGCADD